MIVKDLFIHSRRDRFYRKALVRGEGGSMSILSVFTNHSHYWGIPHERSSDKLLIQTCYECGAERVIRINLRPYLSSSEYNSERA